jgi:hypothetical protein
MVGVINPANATSIDSQRQAAKNAPFQLLPGEPWPAEGNKPGTETVFISSLSPPSSRNNASETYHISSGAIAGVVIGAVLLLVAGLVFLALKRYKACRDVGDNQVIGDFSDNQRDASSVHDVAGLTGTETVISYPNTPSVGEVAYSPAHNLENPTVDEKVVPREGHPGFDGSYQQTTIELQGDSPEVAELPAGNDINSES